MRWRYTTRLSLSVVSTTMDKTENAMRIEVMRKRSGARTDEFP